MCTGVAMEFDSKTKARIAFLNQEMDELHVANGTFWKQGKSQPPTARAEYEFRNERLEKIRAELALIRGEAGVV
jgi:hypothetical protein